MPSLADFAENVGSICFEIGDHAAGCVGVFVACAPDQHFEKCRGEVDAFFGKAVVDGAPVFRILFGGKDAVGVEIFPTCSEDVGCDALTGLLKFWPMYDKAALASWCPTLRAQPFRPTTCRWEP